MPDLKVFFRCQHPVRDELFPEVREGVRIMGATDLHPEHVLDALLARFLWITTRNDEILGWEVKS